MLKFIILFLKIDLLTSDVDPISFFIHHVTTTKSENFID